IAGLLTTGLSDLIGMRTALMISSILFGILAVIVMNIAGRTVCAQPCTPICELEVEAQAQPAPVACISRDDRFFHFLEFQSSYFRRGNATRDQSARVRSDRAWPWHSHFAGSR